MKKQKVNKWVKHIASEFSTVLNKLELAPVHLRVIVEGEKGYEVGDQTLSVSVNYPYKDITFQISNRAIEIAKNDKKLLKMILLHEAFHILHWRFGQLAENRYTSKKELEEEEENLADHFSLIFFDKL